MKLVIDIKEEVYKSIQDNDYCGISNADMYNAIKNGIPHETVTEFADRCRECGREKVLDKIRAEIEKLEYLNIDDGSDGYDKYIEQYEVLKIIDKYKAESEDAE